MVSKAVSGKSCSFQSQLVAGQVAATLAGSPTRVGRPVSSLYLNPGEALA